MTNRSLSLEELLDIQEEDFNTTSTQALLCFCCKECNKQIRENTKG